MEEDLKNLTNQELFELDSILNGMNDALNDMEQMMEEKDYVEEN